METKATFANIVREDLAKSSGATNLVFNHQVKSMIESGRPISHFAFGQSPFPVPEFMQNCLAEFAHKTAYLTTTGIEELRDGIVEFHKRYENINLDKNRILVGPGTKELLYLTILAFNGDIMIPSPAWVTYLPQTKLAQKTPILVDTDISKGWKVTPTTMDKALQGTSSKSNKLLILTNPGNPTGTCYTRNELKDICDYCRKRNIIILSDEIYARFVFEGKHISTAELYPEGTILASGFSKCASVGGWRLGYTHYPEELDALFEAIKSAGSHTYSCATAPVQYAFAKILNHHREEFDEFMVNCTRVLKAVGDYCYRELKSIGIGGCQSEAGFYYMLDFESIRESLFKRGITDGKQMTFAMLQEADVALMSSEFFLRPASELTTRFCFVCFDGKYSLDALAKNKNLLSDNQEQNDKFVNDYCAPIVNGVCKIKNWVLKVKNSG